MLEAYQDKLRGAICFHLDDQTQTADTVKRSRLATFGVVDNRLDRRIFLLYQLCNSPYRLRARREICTSILREASPETDNTISALEIWCEARSMGRSASVLYWHQKASNNMS